MTVIIHNFRCFCPRSHKGHGVRQRSKLNERNLICSFIDKRLFSLILRHLPLLSPNEVPLIYMMYEGKPVAHTGWHQNVGHIDLRF